MVTLAALAAIELLVRTGILAIPNPVALALIAVVYAAARGGLRAGLLGAGLVLLYGVYFFSTAGGPLPAGDDRGRLLVLLVTAPFLAWMTGALKDRSERALREQLEAVRAQAAELQRAEQRRRIYEERLRLTVNALPAYVVYLDRELKVRLHNAAYEELLGLPPEAIDGAPLAQLLGPAIFARIEPRLQSALKGEKVTFERAHEDWKGRAMQIEGQLVPHLDQTGQVIGVFAMLTDITRHKALQARTASLAERLRRALTGSRLVLWELDVPSGVVRLGREWAEIVGGAPEMVEVGLARLNELVHPEDRRQVDAAFLSVMEGRSEQYDVEHRVRALDGEWRWLLSTGRVAERDASGRVLRVSGTNRDITQRKEIELRLRESDAKMRLVTDAVPAMIAYVDTGLRYVFCNRRYCEAMGRADEADVLGRTMLEVIGAEVYEVARPWLGKALAGAQVEYERRLRRPDGQVLDISVSYVPDVAADGAVRGLYALLVDLTERKRAGRIKERFISMVSHELRTPLTSIIWSLEIAGDRLAALPEDTRQALQLAQQNAQRMLHLADEILDMERIDQGELQLNPRATPLAALAERAIALNRAMAEKHGARLAAGALAEAEVRADPDRLLQVLTNFITNAAKHSPPGGQVEVGVARQGEMVRVSVSDRGKGVPAEFQERLFGRFSQSAEGKQRGGAGLGLAICKEIVERSGGRIGYAPNPQGGSIFWFELRVERQPAGVK